MVSKRVVRLPFGSLLSLVMLNLINIIPLVESASSLCGCIEMEKLKSFQNKSSIRWNDLHDETHDKCDLFCGSKMSTRFVQIGSGVCHCFNDTQLQTFDCDEVQLSTSTVSKVYCVHARFNVHQALSLHAAIFESPLKTLRSSQGGRGIHKEGESEFIEVHEDESFDVSSGIAPAAILLALISMAVLILLAVKTWVDHQRKKAHEKAGTKGDIEGVKESKDQSGGGFSWNFDDYKIKETRGENYI